MDIIQSLIDFIKNLLGSKENPNDIIKDTGKLQSGTLSAPKKTETVSAIKKKYPSWNQYDSLFIKWSSFFGIEWKYLKAIAIVESTLGKNRQGYDGKSTGLMHLIETTANDLTKELKSNYGIDLLQQFKVNKIDLNVLRNGDEISIILASLYLKKSKIMFPGNTEAQIKSYNMGWGNTKKWLNGGKDYSTITSDYFNKWTKAFTEVNENLI